MLQHCEPWCTKACANSGESKMIELMDDSEIKNPLAKRMHEKRDAQDAQRGADLLEKDFIKKGTDAAPAHFTELTSRLTEYVERYNAERPKISPALRYSRNRVEAGTDFAVEFELEGSRLEFRVGPQFLTDETMREENPMLRVRERQFQAYEDDKGFTWRDGEGRRYSNPEIVEVAMNALGELL